MDNRPPLPPLMPAPHRNGPPSGVHDNRSSFIRQKRRQVAAACDNCRKRKEKCDDKRPTCGPCARRGVICNNGSKDDDGSSNTALKNRNLALRRENDQLRDLFLLLRRLPADEGQEVVARMRSADDPIQVLKSFQDATLPLSNPPLHPNSDLLDSRLERIDLFALRESPIRVDARPWTAVASDGLVSELISSFFVWDDAFYLPFIDREAFLDDMRSNRPATAKYCTPFLVNALCAARCYTCRRTKAFSHISKRDLANEFLNEAKKLLDLEAARASIPTVQGLTLLFSISAYIGTDRAGMLYRFAAYEMFHRLNVDAMYDEIKDDPTKARDRSVLSRLAWGLFCFESIVGYIYLQLSMIPPPRIPRCFEPPPARTDGEVPNVDMFGNPHTKESKTPPFVMGALYLACDITMMLYKSMQYNARSEGTYGTEGDLRVRRQLLDEVRQWRADLPPNMREDVNFTPQTCYLSAYVSEVLISILRPLDPQTEIKPGWTAKSLCLNMCRADIDIMERFVQVYTLRDYACINICGAYNSILILVFHLADPAVHDMFTKASRLILQTGADFPMSRYILQGIKAMAWSLKVAIPPSARPYYANLGRAKETFRDVPISFALPEVTSVRRMLTDSQESTRSRNKAEDMGTLLSKWSAMSIE